LEALVHFTEGKDTFVDSPAGYGKSIVFAILPLVFDKMLYKTTNYNREKHYTCKI